MSERVGEIVAYFSPRDTPSVTTFSPRERAILEEVNARIAGRASLQEVLEYLFTATKAISPCDRIGVAFVEDDGRIVARSAIAEYEPLVLQSGYAEPLEETSLQRVIDENTVRIIYDLAAYAANKPESRSSALLVREGVGSSLTCPLRVDERNVGVLFRSARQIRAYDARQVGFFMAVAERLSQAVEKTRRIEQLEEANRAYTEMLGFVSHELKSPLGNVITNANLLLEGYVGELGEKQRELVRRMHRAAEHLLGLTREYLDLARVEGQELALRAERIDFVRDVVEPALEVALPTIEAAEMELERAWEAEPIEIEADANLLRIVVINLLSNAAKYGVSGGTVRLAAERAGARVRCAVRNDGPGFPANQRGRLFRRFSRLDAPALKRKKGTGVGLYTCMRIIKLHGGRIDARSVEGAWAEFWFEV